MREIQKKAFRKACKICHKKSYWVSRNGLCKDCCVAQIKLANLQMKTKKGNYYEKWKEKIIKGLERLSP